MGLFNRKRSKQNEPIVDKPVENKNTFDANYIKLPARYARELMRQMTYNTANAGKNKSYTFTQYDKEDIIKWLQSPSSSTNEKNLRNASIYMYHASMHYNRLLNYYAGLYTGAYIISPLNFSGDDVRDNFKKQYKKVSKALELMDIPKLIHDETLIALREGAFYGVLLSDNNSAFIQKIDPDYCKITSICDGSYLYKVDMTRIATKLEFYPAEFTTMYNNYLATGDKWQEVPLEISVCVKGDPTIVDYTIPPFAAVMPSIYSISNTESLQETADELKNYKMLSGQIPSDDKGNPLIPDDLIAKYYAQIAQNLDDNVGLALSPFNLTSFSFEGRDAANNVDSLARVVSNFWSTAGTSGLLHGQSNNTSGVTKLAIKNDETYILGIIQQIERIINRYLKTNFSSTSKFKITILPVTVFNKEDYLKYYKEAAAFGIGKSYYAAALGIPQCDMAGLNYIEKNLMPFDELVPLQSTYTTASGSGDIGRPEKALEDLEEEGEATRDNDSNANR